MSFPVIMIELAGRSPRLVRRWHDLGLLKGFSMLSRCPSLDLANGGRCFDELSGRHSRLTRHAELWGNDLALRGLPDYLAGKTPTLPDLGTELIISQLPEDHSASELVRVMYQAGFSLLAIGRALKSRHSLRLNGQFDSDRFRLDWLRWEVFKARWLEDEPHAALLSLPGPDALLHRPVPDQSVQSPVCPERQVEYAQALLASYLMVDSITRQAVRIAQQRQIALIVSIEPSTANSTSLQA